MFQGGNATPSKPRLRHVILISSGFPPKGSLGGAEFQALNLSKYLWKRGSEVHVITTSERIVPYHEMVEGVFVHRVLYSKRPTFSRFASYVCFFLEIVRHRPNIVHGIGIFPDGLIACLSSRILRKPLILMSRDSDVRLEHPLIINLFWKMILRSVQTMVVKEKESAKRLLRYGIDPQDVFVLSNGVDKSRFRLNRRKCRQRIGLRGDEKAILYVGRLEPVKNVESLLIAFARIREEFRDVRLFLVGAGTQMSRLMTIAAQTRIDHCVNFIGELSPSDVPRYMVAADVFVLPSISEGSPNVILEALAAGLPIIASTVGGVPDLVTDTREGFLFKAGNVGEMVNLLTLMLRDGQLRRKMSREGRRRADEFSLDGVNDKIFQISVHAVNKISKPQL